jgi:hypothetical protein
MTPDDIEEFLEVLDRYGGRLEDWPQLARARAEALLAASPQARTQLSAMRRAEAALAATRPADAKGTDTLAFHAMRAIQDKPRRRVRRRLSWALAGTLALIAGVYVGAAPLASENPADIVTAALDQPGGHDVW